jgi:hypothetical protein
MLGGVLLRPASLFAAFVGLCACRSDDGYRELRIENPWGRWERDGFARLETSNHVPSSSERVDQVEIWAKLPDDSPIKVTQGPNGPTLSFPPGSELDRVELAGHDDERRVVDVRGTRIDEAGMQQFHVYRKEAAGRDKPMFGLEWPRDDAKATAAATEAFIARLKELPPGKGYKPERLEKYVGSLRKKNDCAGCHLLDRAQNQTQGQHGLVNRRTDADGFYSPLAVLYDEAPIERYGGHDLNVPDPYVTVSCGERTAEVADSGKPYCADKAVVTGRLTLAEALSASDPRAQAVCESRRYLYERMDDEGKRLFAAHLKACSTTP